VAIGRQAILAGYTVLFVPAPTLVTQLAKAHSEGRLEDRLTHFGKPRLLIVDELGYRSSPMPRICSSSSSRAATSPAAC
jgi:DNA replication protein DnaC